MKYFGPRSMCVLCLLVAGCNQPTPVPPAAVKVVPELRAVQLGASTLLRAEATTVADPAWTYQWHANRGTVVPSAATATYTAGPDLEPGYDVVSVSVMSGETVVEVAYCPLVVYRQFVILLCDDFPVWKAISDNWKYYLEQVVDNRRIKTAPGLITEYLDPDYNDNVNYERDMQYIKARYKSGYVEFWNHAYDHASGDGWQEFNGTTLSYQQDHIERGQELAKSVLGITLTAFGASFWFSDDTTRQVLENIPDIEVWIEGPSAGTTKMVITRSGGRIETDKAVPSFSLFQSTYQPDQALVVMQHHPYEESFRSAFSEFDQILDYLTAQGVTFILPTECKRLMSDGILPILDPLADSNGDGKADGVQGVADRDDDGLPNFLDDDSDKLLVLDAAENARR